MEMFNADWLITNKHPGEGGGSVKFCKNIRFSQSQVLNA